MTWNILRCEAGVETIAAEIRPHKPDIVFLQEVLRPDYTPIKIDQGAEIAARLDGLQDYSVTSLRSGNVHKWGDPAILSRWPVKEARFVDAGDGGRSYGLVTTLDVRGKPLHLICVHANGTWKADLRHVFDSVAARHHQIKHLLGIVDELEGDVLIAGDFNTPEWMPDYRLMCASWTDLGRPGDPSLFTLTAERPTMRIDYIFGRGNFESRKYEVISTTASDHRPVVADLVIRKGATSRPQDRRYDGSPSTSE